MNNEVPTFLADRVNETQLAFKCPRCGKRNMHGACGKFLGNGDGHRVSHCPCWPQGYIVKEKQK